MNALTPMSTSTPMSGLVPNDMASAMRLADMMASSKLLPTYFHGKPGDCFLVIEQAMRWNMSPFAVAACTSVVQGKLMYEGKLVAAAVQSSGVIEGRLEYEFSGTGDKRAVKVTAKIRGEGKPRDLDVTLEAAKTSNQWWTKTPDQMLSYYGARAWARRHTPEVMLGVYSPEEFEQPADSFRGVTVDSVAEAMPAAAAVAATAAPPQRVRKPFMEMVEDWLSVCKTLADVDAVEMRESVQNALNNAPDDVVHKINGLLSAARKRIQPDQDDTREPASESEDEYGEMPE